MFGRTLGLVVAFTLVVAGCGVRTSLDVPRDGSTPSALDASVLDAARPDAPSPCRDDLECDDGVECNGVEHCAAGHCVPGERPFCADGIECTRDECIEGLGCVNEPDDSLCDVGGFCDPSSGCSDRPCGSDADCDDGRACNGVERCNPARGVCVRAPAIDCDDGVACTRDECIEPFGACAARPDDTLCPDGRSCDPVRGCGGGGCRGDDECDDRLACNGRELCRAGRCIAGTPIVCTDPFACTIDFCDESAGGACASRPSSALCPMGEVCSPVPGDPDGCRRVGCTDDAACRDASFCNGEERCVAGRCVAGRPVECAVMDECAVGTCSEAARRCVVTPRAMRDDCENGLDDDCDMLRDCDDVADCARHPACACVPSAPIERVCNDGIDDDCDARIDCSDPDCRVSPLCRDAGPPIRDAGVDAGARDAGTRDAGPPPRDAGGPVRNELGIAACTNGIDDDRDGRTDCADSDCRPFGANGECCNGIDDIPDDDTPADVFTCRCFDDSTCLGVSQFDQVCWRSRFSVCAPRCNFVGGDAWCRALDAGFTRCDRNTGECL